MMLKNTNGITPEALPFLFTADTLLRSKALHRLRLQGLSLPDFAALAGQTDRSQTITAQRPTQLDSDTVSNLPLAALVGPDIVGTNGADTLTGTANDEVILGLDGNDVLEGLAGADTLRGGNGNDQLMGGDGPDVLNGNAGDDTLFGDDGNDTAIVDNFDGIDFFDGGSGFDTIQFSPPDNRNLVISVVGGFVGDGRGGGQIFSNFERIIGGGGNDRILGDSANNFLQGGPGNDTLTGGAGNDSVIVNNFSGIDFFDGGSGFDTIRFAPTDNRDLVISVAGGFVGDGQGGGQIFSNFERIIGGGGNDRLIGDDNNNLLRGEAGQDSLTGGAGTDRFVLTSLNHAGDTFIDFDPAEDILQINAAGFGAGLQAGPLAASQFVQGTVAQDPTDRVLYDQSTGTLFFDGDGAGGDPAVQIASLPNQPILNASDIVIAGSTPQLTTFDIEVNFTDSSLTASQQAIFTSAANRWEEIITADIPDVFVPGFGLVDDVVIDASAPVIDGPGMTLGQAGPTAVRLDSFLPARGVMAFDQADVAALEANGRLEAVILHEMGHVLGLGTVWDNLGLVIGAGGPDPQYVGSDAVAEYNSLFGINETSVPVANTGGPGTRDSHWRESVFDNELMTGFLDVGINPISRVTVGALADLGYTVNLGAADPYTPPNTVPLLAANTLVNSDIDPNLSAALDGDVFAPEFQVLLA